MSSPIGGSIPREQLREATLAGIRWVTLARIVAEVVVLGTMVILARLIPPSEFGLVAIALIVQSLGLVLAGEGVGAALVQRRELDKRHLESAAFLGLAIGGSLSAATLVAGLGLGRIVDSELPGLISLVSPVFVLNSTVVVPLALLQRRMDFRRTSLVEVAALLSSACTSVALALVGLDAHAVVIGSVVGSATTAGLGLALAPWVWPRLHSRELREIASFGVPAALAGLTVYGFRNVDYAIVGAKLGAAQLGFYWRAYQLGVEYQRKILKIVGRLALPVYSRAEGLADMRQMRLRIARMQAAIVFPLLTIFILVAPDVVPWLLGPAWTPSVVPAQILAGVGMIISVQAGIGPVLLAAGKARLVLAWNAASVVVYAAVVMIFAGKGVVSVALAVLGFHLAQSVLMQGVLMPRILGISPRQVGHELAPAITGSLAAAGAGMAVKLIASAADVPSLASVPLVAAVAGAVYLALVRYRFGAAWSDGRLLASRLLGRPRSAPSAPSAPVSYATR